MSRRRKITYGILVVYLAGLIALSVIYGIHTHKNNTFNIVDAYHLTTWVHLFGPLNINKGVLYLLMTAVMTIGILLWVARRMEMRPNRVQTAVEWGYDLAKRLTNDSMGEPMARRWFPLVFALFVFVLVTNLLGYIPLPVNTADKITSPGRVSRRSRSMPPTPMSRFRWYWRWASSSPTTSRVSVPTGSGGI